MASKILQRNKTFQKTPEDFVLKHQRDSSTVLLRKKKRLEHSNKKRANFGVESEISNQFIFPAEIVPANLAALYPGLTANISFAQRLNCLSAIVIDSNTTETLQSSISCLKQIISINKNFPYTLTFNQKLIEKFLNVLNSTVDQLKVEVLCCLINIFIETNDIMTIFIDKNIIETICFIIKNTSNKDLIENCVWCIGNLLGEGSWTRDRILAQSIHKELILYTGSNDLGLKKISFWALSNLCNKSLMHISIAKDIIKVIKIGLVSDDIDIIIDSAWISKYLTDTFVEIVDLLFEIDIVRVIIALTHNYNIKVQFPVLKVLGNISGQADWQLEDLVSKGLIPSISTLLTHPNNSIKKEVLFIFSNLFAGSNEVIMILLDSPCMKNIIQFMDSYRFELRKEALWGVSNAACCKNIWVVRKVLDLKVVSYFIKGLGCNDADLLLNILEAISNILDFLSQSLDSAEWYEFFRYFTEIDGFTSIEKLRIHSNSKITTQSEKILNFYGSSINDTSNEMDLYNYN